MSATEPSQYRIQRIIARDAPGSRHNETRERDTTYEVASIRNAARTRCSMHYESISGNHLKKILRALILLITYSYFEKIFGITRQHMAKRLIYLDSDYQV